MFRSAVSPGFRLAEKFGLADLANEPRFASETNRALRASIFVTKVRRSERWSVRKMNLEKLMRKYHYDA